MGAAEHIELETWELFMAVMESGSYLQPARAMNVDPSTVSRRLRKLEDRLRMQLFYRESTGLRPTAAGRRVMNQMHDVLTDILAVRDGLAKSVSGVRGRIRVSIPEPIQTDAVWEVMSQLEFENTGLRLDLEPPGSGDDPAGLAFQVSPMIPTGSRPVSLLPLVCVASPGYLAEHGTPESPEALTEHTLIFSELSSYSRRFTFSRSSSRSFM